MNMKSVNEIKRILPHAKVRIQTVKTGISAMAVEDFMHIYKIPRIEMARIVNLSLKTLSRVLNENRLLDQIHSDRLMELTELYQKGEEVFGNKEKFIRWLNSSHPALGNIRPAEWLDSQQGIDAIMDELVRIDEGILA
jgi:putative toxin-antitoxin system antitoxin component (TIGR02293 family)